MTTERSPDTATGDDAASTDGETPRTVGETRPTDGDAPTTDGDAPTTDGDASTARDTKAAPKRKKKPRRSTARRVLSKVTELPLLVLAAFVIAVIIKTFLVQAFFIPSGSMKPTLQVGDRVLVEKITYLLDGPDRGDVVVFAKSVFVGGQKKDLPWYDDARNFLRELIGLRTGEEEDYIKRVVAVGGDTIRYEGRPRILYVNGERVDEPYIKGGRDNTSGTFTSRDCKKLEMDVAGDGCRVPAGKVFVMGDNRGDSQDSRLIGPVDEDKIVGHAFVVIWPPADFGGL